jgi:hypothetical protein
VVIPTVIRASIELLWFCISGQSTGMPLITVLQESSASDCTFRKHSFAKEVGHFLRGALTPASR